MTAELREVIQPDIFITGDANLLIEPEAKKTPSGTPSPAPLPCSCTSA